MSISLSRKRKDMNYQFFFFFFWFHMINREKEVPLMTKKKDSLRELKLVNQMLVFKGHV